MRKKQIAGEFITLDENGPQQGAVRSSIQFADTGAADAFGRLRMSEPFTLYDSATEYNALPLFWENIVTGTGSATHTPNSASVTLTVGTDNNDRVVRQTKRYFRYQPGKSQQILMTFTFGAAVTNTRKRAGYYDDRNGIYVESDDTMNIVKRSYKTGTAVDTSVPQSSWNLDTLDGSGNSDNPSGVTFDRTKAQILIIDLEWLGVGRVRVGFVIDGAPRYCHQFLQANEAAGVYMSTANLPLRYEIVNVGTSAGATFEAICAAVASEGGVQERNLTFSVSNGATLRQVTNAALPVLALRCGTAFPSGGTLLYRGIIEPSSMEIYTEDAAIYWQAVYNPTVLGGSWVAADATHSGAEYNVSGTAISGGVVIDSGYAVATNQSRAIVGSELQTDLTLTNNVAGTAGDTLAIVCTRVTATSSDTAVSLKFKELY